MKRAAVPILLLAVLGVLAAEWMTRDGPLGRRDSVPGDGATGSRPPTPSPAPSAPSLAGAGSTQATGTVAGTVLRDGKPVSGRVVVRPLATASLGDEYASILVAAPAAPATVAEASAGPDGRFQIAQLPPAAYLLDATGVDGARGRAWIDSLGADQRREVVIALRSGHESVRGRVADRDGRPWRGRVRVLLDGAGDAPYDEANPSVRWTTTDEGGRFEVTGLFGGRVSVHAVDPAKACVRGPWARLPYRGDYVLLVPTESDGVSGVVRADDTGAPIAGAVVTARDPSVPSVFRRVTGEDGRFAIPLPDTRSEVEVRASGFSGVSDWFERGDKAVAFHLRHFGTVRGRVTADHDGGPVAGVGIYVAWGRGGQALQRGRTDAGGVYEVTDLPAGEISVYARGSGWIPRGIEQAQNRGWNPCAVSVGPGSVTVEDLVVVRGARATGHVRAPDGIPVAGAVVSATPSRPYGDGLAPLGALLGGEAATTSGDGTFAFTTLVGGVEYAFVVRAEGFPPARPGSRVADPTHAIDLDVRLAAPRWAEVRVVEKGTGAPIARAEVTVAPVGTDGAGGYAGEWTTGEDGVARIGPLAAGTYSVDATAADRPADWVNSSKAMIADAETTARITLELEAGFGISGRVELPDRTPAAGASVLCDCDDGNVECQTEVADGEGRFLFEGLRIGEHDLQATLAGGGRSASVRVTTAERDIVLTLAPREDEASAPDPKDDRTGRGVFVGDSQGRPVPRAMIYLRDPDGLRYVGWTRVIDGRATLDPGRASRSVVLEVFGSTTAGGTPLPFGVAWVPVHAEAGPIEVRLPSETPIEGTVVGPDKRPIAGVLLQAMPARVPEPEARRKEEEIVSTARSDRDGRFRLSGLGPEPCRVYLSPPPGCARPDPLAVDGGMRGLVVRLGRGVSPTVTVLDPDGRPVAGALVSASVGPHEYYLEWPDSIVTVLNEGGIARTGDVGTVRLEALDADRTYDLYVGVPRGRTDILGLDTPKWTPADTTIRLRKTETVRGIVRDPSGRVVPGAFIECKRDGRRAGATYADEDGAFEIEGLPAGPVVVHASPPGGDEDGAPDTATAETTAGATGVLLVVRPTVEMVVRIENWSPSDAAASKGFNARITREPIADDSPDHTQSLDRQGIVRFRGLSPGASYTLWIGPSAGGRMVHVRGVKGGGPEVVVRLETGQALRGRVTLPPGANRARVHVVGVAWSASADVGADGNYELPGLPPGPCRLTARAEVGGEERTVSVDATTGRTIDLDLAAK